MCLAIPAKIAELGDSQAKTEDGKEIDTSLITEELKEGDYLLVHDQMAVNKLGKKEAEKIIKVVEKCDHNH